MDRIILFSIPGKKSFSDRFTETARVYLRSPPSQLLPASAHPPLSYILEPK